MKKKYLPILLFILCIAVITGCQSDKSSEDQQDEKPKDPVKAGIQYGKLVCENKALDEEADEMYEDLWDLDNDSRSDRKKYISLQQELIKLYRKSVSIEKEMMDLKAVQWKFYEDEDEYDKWVKKFEKASEEESDKCRDEEEEDDYFDYDNYDDYDDYDYDDYEYEDYDDYEGYEDYYEYMDTIALDEDYYDDYDF